MYIHVAVFPSLQKETLDYTFEGRRQNKPYLVTEGVYIPLLTGLGLGGKDTAWFGICAQGLDDAVLVTPPVAAENGRIAAEQVSGKVVLIIPRKLERKKTY